jgi:hypothetical protein
MKLARVLVPLLVLDVVLFTLSGVYKNAHHGAGWVIGGVGWFGFCLLTLALIVYAAVAIVRSRRRTGAAAA